MKHIIIETPVYLLLPVLILLFPNGWVISWIIAAAIHEAFHLLALHLFKIKILSFQIGIAGAKIETESITPGKELFCALAGPLGALLILPFSRYIPRIVICTIAQSIYNLLPVYPLDGGRALRCLLTGKVKHYSLIEKSILYVIIVCCLSFAVLMKLGIVLIILAFSLLIKFINANSPCKERTHRVQ